LNLLYNFNLSKNQIESPQNKIIDLHDLEREICVQVTANNTKAKVETTVKNFIDNELYKTYKELHFLIIDRNIDFNYDKNKLNEKFGVQIKFHDSTTILKTLINDFDTATKIKPVYNFVISELAPEKVQNGTNTIISNITTTSDLPKLRKELHLVDQILESLKVFEGFSFIHPRTISRLPIFNKKESHYNAYSHYCLKTSNKAIHELLQKIKVEDTVVRISDDSLKPFEKKLKQIFLILNNCLIQCICYREKYTEIKHHEIVVKQYENNCNCLSCQFHEFRIKTLFTTLKGKAITHSENLENALAEGYYLCKLGEHIKGWQVLNSVAEKSKNSNNFVIYFLSLYNIKQIRGFIDSPWWKSENKQILPKIDEIDLCNTINTFSIPIQLRDELIKIKENYYLHYSREIIDEQFERILDTKKLYENGGYSSGTSAVNLLLEELYILYTFYSVNHIVADDFYTFKQVITKGIEGVLISFTTDKSYEYKFKEFNNLLLLFMLFFLNEKKLEGFLKKYKIESIPIAKKEKEKFISVIINFFSFQYTIGHLDNIDFNDDIAKQNFFSLYRQSLRFIFNKIIILLSKVELTDEELKPITQPFIDYLKVSENFNHNNWVFALRFFRAKIQIFSGEQIEKIIKLAVDEKQYCSRNEVLETICELAFEKTNFVLINKDKALFDKLINSVTMSDNRCNRGFDIFQVLAPWKIVDKTGKQIIKQKVVEYLQNKFDSNIYMHAGLKGVFNKDEYPDLLENFIKNAVKSCSFFDVKEEKGRWKIQSFDGYNHINCLAFMNVDFKQENIQAIAKKSDYYNWLINYDTFDYSNFNTKWLTQLDFPYYNREKLKQIDSLRVKVEEELKKNHDAKLAKFYIKYLIE
ncbi:MAG: SMEK domain-containing protein, partial [Bacteroidales bacterium]|nr:SMEK domain-containing protein [Bacteroidales bacterium]